MRAVVVYESMFGNTKQIAGAIAKGVSTAMEVDVVDVGDAPTTIGSDIDLVVAGGPTHAFGLSRPGTRKSAADQGADISVTEKVGIREWLTSLPPARAGQLAAAFDTHTGRPRWLPGSAARGAAARLRSIGYRLVAPPRSFFVTGTTGPLIGGELDRAYQWGEQLATMVSTRQHHG